MATLAQLVASFFLSLASPQLLSPVAAQYHPSLTPIPVVIQHEFTGSQDQLFQWRELEQQLLTVAGRYPRMRLGVSVRDIATGMQVSLNGDQQMIAASTTKLIAAISFLRRIDDDTYTWEKKVGSYSAQFQLEQLVRYSNNDSWDRFNSLISLRKQQSLMEQWGVAQFDAANNTITPNDLALLLSTIYRREILSPGGVDALLAVMHDTHEERFIPAALPAHIVVYHKTGTLESMFHDAAILDNGEQHIALVIFTDYPQNQNPEERVSVFHELTQGVVTTLRL